MQIKGNMWSCNESWPSWFACKVGGTRNQPPYVIVLYKRQDAQNVGFKKKKEKKKGKDWVKAIWNYGTLMTLIFLTIYTSSRAPVLASKPYLVAMCDGWHDICDLPTLPLDLSGLDRRHWWNEPHILCTWCKISVSKSRFEHEAHCVFEGCWAFQISKVAMVSLCCLGMSTHSSAYILCLFWGDFWGFSGLGRAPCLTLTCHVMHYISCKICSTKFRFFFPQSVIEVLEHLETF